jgi:hypothetical protein
LTPATVVYTVRGRMSRETRIPRGVRRVLVFCIAGQAVLVAYRFAVEGIFDARPLLVGIFIVASLGVAIRGMRTAETDRAIDLWSLAGVLPALLAAGMMCRVLLGQMGVRF